MIRTAMDAVTRASAPLDELPLFAPRGTTLERIAPAPKPVEPPGPAPLTEAQHATLRALIPIAKELMRTGGYAQQPGTLRAWEVLYVATKRGLLHDPVPESISQRMGWFMKIACGFKSSGRHERTPADVFPSKHGNLAAVWVSAVEVHHG